MPETPYSPDPVAAAEALAPAIRGAADAIEAGRRLPLPLVRQMAEAGLFRMAVPRALGGGEVEVGTMLRAIEVTAQADGSAGWCLMIGTTSGVIGAYLPHEVGLEVYGGPEAISGGVFAPSGTAAARADGYVVNGRWAFASGCEHCTWLMGGSVILDDGRPRMLPNGMPDARLMLFPAAQAQVIDTWTVSGLRGTGSHDISVTDLEVPAARAVSLSGDHPQHPGPLYAFPVFGLLALGIAAVATGIARRAVDELVALAAAKTPTGARRSLRDRAMVQVQVAQAEAVLRSARAFLFDTVAEVSAAAAAAGAISVQQRGLLRLAATHATTASAQVADLMYNAGGGTSIYAKSPLQRCFRDVHAATQHLMVAAPTYELVGRLLLGVDTDTTQL